MEAPHLDDRQTRRKKRLLVNIIVSLLLVALGVAGLQLLARMRTPPAEVASSERALRVEVQTVVFKDIEVPISGFGEVRALNSVMLAAEVAGRVVAVHPRLEVGETVGEGELLFEIDSRNYASAQAEAAAAVGQWRATIARLKKQKSLDRNRLQTLQRNQDLAQKEFERVKTLFAKDKLVTRSAMEQAERTYNQTVDQTDQMASAVALYPARISEAQSSLASAEARQRLALTNLERCKVTAPFTGRIKMANLEPGQYVAPGQGIVTLADDSRLEIQVALDSQDARKWLSVEPDRGRWFGKVKPVPCKIYWVEDRTGGHWTGVLQRVVHYAADSRTLTVAVAVDNGAQGQNRGLPLVEGMFCEVVLVGKTIRQVAALPASAVSFDKTVYLVKEGRLKTMPVSVARLEKEVAYINDGLAPGDQVIITRLSDPIENSLVEIVNRPEKKAAIR